MCMTEINKELKIIAAEEFQEVNDFALDVMEEELVLEELMANPRFYGPDYGDYV